MKAADKTEEVKQSHIYKLRHSLAHIMAQAVLEIRPDARLGFGPPVDNGFYYDFDFGEKSISDEDFKDIEKRMSRIVKEKQEFKEFQKPFSDAEKMLNESDQSYKIEYAKELVETNKAQDGNLNFYQNGPFIDMCEGPHLEHTGQVPKKCFKLDRIAGSYWRGDEKRPMLTRIYGLAFEDVKLLKEYIQKRELARQREHRKLGAELDIFVIDEEVGVGLPLWLPNGTIIRDELENWANEVEFRGGYQKVSTPTITRSQLYYTSGHLPYYKDSMYPPMKVDEHDEYYLRPMNCPHHHKLYASRPRSYRNIPLRLAEYGNTYRYEKHGSLAGLLRVRAMCMNDAHIYCEYDQVKEEFKQVMDMYSQYYKHLRLGNFRVCLSLHEPDTNKFIGDEEEWIRSENIVREILTENNIEFEEETGEAAFYGPKVDVQITNILDREETVSTCQLDFVMAEKFKLTYTAKDGTDKRPYIIHRAPLSTHERMVSFLIEFYGGAFPTWMAPLQVCLVPVNEECFVYAREIQNLLRDKLFRAEVDEGSERFNKKIRNAVTSKIPNIWVIGNKEAEQRTITWRRYCTKKQTGMQLYKAVEALEQWRKNRAMDNFEDVEIPQ